MKLSDKDLHYALWCAEKHTGNSLYTEAMADLEEGVLEIKGYERSANVGSPEIDGKPLSEGEIALIKALRKTWGFAEILKPGDSVVVTKAENGEYISTTHNISFMLIEGDGSNTEVVNALEIIGEEHREENRRAIQRMNVIGLTAAKIFQKEAQNETK